MRRKKDGSLTKGNPGYRAAPALSSTLEVRSDSRRGGGLNGTGADSGGLHVHDHSTTHPGARKTNARAALNAREATEAQYRCETRMLRWLLFPPDVRALMDAGDPL